MFQNFFNAICQIGIFMICAQTIIHFRPNKKYENYLKLLVGVMILVQVFLPIIQLFTSGEMESMEESVKRFEQQLQESMSQAALRSDEILSQMTLDEMKSLLSTSDADEISEGEENLVSPIENVILDEIEVTIR